MPLPLGPLISAVTPLVLGALDQYRKRREERLKHAAVPGAEDVANPAALHTRLEQLEDSDLEQARLISELSRNVETLARTLQIEVDRRARLERLVWVALAAAAAGLSLAIGFR